LPFIFTFPSIVHLCQQNNVICLTILDVDVQTVEVGGQRRRVHEPIWMGCSAVNHVIA